MKSFIRICLILLVASFSATSLGQIEIFNKSLSPGLVIKPADRLIFDVSGVSRKEISAGRITAKVTRFGAVVKETTQNLCPHLLHTRCTIRPNDFTMIRKEIIMSRTLPNGWYHFHITVTDQDNEVILDTGKCFKYHKDCKAGVLCYIF